MYCLFVLMIFTKQQNLFLHTNLSFKKEYGNTCVFWWWTVMPPILSTSLLINEIHYVLCCGVCCFFHKKLNTNLLMQCNIPNLNWICYAVITRFLVFLLVSYRDSIYQKLSSISTHQSVVTRIWNYV